MKHKRRRKYKPLRAPDQIIVRSAQEISEEDKQRISVLFGDNLRIQEEIDETLIGGIRIQKKTELFDGSIRSQLDKLRHKLYNLKTYDRHK
ncbi:MAG: F0F1 ATP synthase subunit delta [Candidatus Dojkabacteria bacterium]|uniref:ATP synthase subunit delta n=2 Tax=Candidatus Dojkabacteria TaxID=74243 RepID=A0A136KEK1_9BACT|nr:MAG: ATP synthase subunit delta [candidate division WS6 bacterium OLB21]MBW7953498.1 F0F1 ATP synthase subunit delta [Candidatus Dojkabacteria bacterium]WKZ28171.1 MAG: F0F1 ATP synthase subunit delta [Candidatus Dojkabacteria bacterium]